ncbi:nucleotide-binding protein [Methanoplanus sp. FWC-SCC4]|uniref:Nucleotide-binding protein n=1 Tax=Methanochimaera problematica TaxID=2609417 RepID=A0AA97FDX6_9EURY|nr:nucleotide-binding protein [Methanoplanus sp. FWC-SCC4]WOF17082.1 nucleotide-binding protein [Methanoplanus sp. FWC-SCC4]
MASDRNGNTNRVSVLLDANALMTPAEFGVDIFSEIELLVGAFEPLTLTEVVSELKGLSTGKGRCASAARVGHSLSRRCRIENSPVSGIPVDDMIVRYAEENGCMVMTNDRGLRNKLLKLHIDVIVLRNQKTLEIIRG